MLSYPSGGCKLLCSPEPANCLFLTQGLSYKVCLAVYGGAVVPWEELFHGKSKNWRGKTNLSKENL